MSPVTVFTARLEVKAFENTHCSLENTSEVIMRVLSASDVLRSVVINPIRKKS